MNRESGFTLTEIAIVMAIMAILLGLGLPSYRNYIANQRVLSSAEVFMAGMQMARAEAVKLNRRVEFLMTTVDPVAANVDTTSTSTTGRNWMVRAIVAGGNTFVEGKSGAEGSGSSSASNSSVAITGSVASVTFDGYGIPVGLTATATFDFTNPRDGCVAGFGGTSAGPVRCLRVRLNRGGQARLCDPTVVATDTRACGT